MKLVFTVCYVLLIFTACKKHSSDSDTIIKNKGTVFINGNDPRFASIETDDKRITFYGMRGSDGSPQKLYGYSVTSLSDSTKYDYVNLDDSGRYTNLVLKTGESLRFDYLPNDSVVMTVSGPDSVSNIINARVANFNNTPSLPNYNKVSPSSLRMGGTDKNVNIKVSAINTFDNKEYDVKNSETSVRVRYVASPNIDRELMAFYDNNKGLYYTPLSAAGFNFNTNNAVDKTISLIKNVLEVACAKTNSANSSIDKSIPALISLRICPLPHPYAKAVCIASNIVLFACYSGKILDALKTIEYNLDPNSIAPKNADIIVTSIHSKYGLKSEQTTIDKVIINSSAYDIKITHSYKEEIYNVGDTAFGGVVFDVDNSGKHGYVCSKVDLSTGANWNAAKIICSNYTSGGLTNWSLPTSTQLVQIYNNRNRIGNFSTNCDNSNFSNCSYWSSTPTPDQASCQCALCLYFTTGIYWSNYVYTANARVRAVHAF